MKDILAYTAWTMERPKAYGPLHLSFFLIGLAIVILIAFALRRSNEKQNKVILISVGTFLIITEIYKQLFYYFILQDEHYPLWIFPFQLCSIPMYLCIIVPFIKNKKVQNAFYNFLLAFNLMGGFVAFLEPSGLLHESVMLTLHSLTWHMTLVFVGFYLGFSGRAGQRMKDFKGACIVFFCMCGIASLINIVLHPLGEINMFFISPYVQSPIIVFQDIYKNFGWWVNTPIFILALSLGGFLFFILFIGLNALENRRKEKVQQMSNDQVKA